MTGVQRFLAPLLLLWPVAGLAYSWAVTEMESHEGVEWDVPIAGYDPRDLLRGHYVQYRYDWPGLQSDEDNGAFRSVKGSVICIRGKAPVIVRTLELDDYADDYKQQASSCDAVVKYNPWSEEGTDGLNSDRLFLSQDRAQDYQKKLADPQLQAIARVRVNKSGHIVPIDIGFRSRSTEGAPADE